MRMLISLFLLLFFAFLSAYVAKQRGRDPIAWFMIGILLGIFAPILLMILKPVGVTVSQDKVVEENEEEKLELIPQNTSANDFGNKVWFYIDPSHQQQGPIYFAQLKALWSDAKIQPSTYVWCEGMQDWKRIQELPGFLEAL